MDHQTSEPTTRYTDVYGSYGSAIVKQEPQNDYLQMESVNDSIEVSNIAPIVNNQSEICKIEDIYSITLESYYKWCEISENSFHPAMKAENELNVCDGNQVSERFNRDVSVKTESIETDNTSSLLMGVSGAIDCKDDISSNVTSGICVGGVNQADEKQSDQAQEEPCSDLESTEEIQTEGM